MPDEEATSEAEIVPTTDNGGVATEERIQALAMRAMGKNSYTPSEAQIDRLIDLREKAIDYTYKERTTWNPQQVTPILRIGCVTVILLIVFLVVAFHASEYLGEFITGLFGLLAGFGLGKSEERRSTQKKADTN